MIQVIKDIIWGWQCKRAIKKANKLSELLGMKYYVIYMNGSLKVVLKRTIRELVAKHRFRKGVKVADIERRAIMLRIKKGGASCLSRKKTTGWSSARMR